MKANRPQVLVVAAPSHPVLRSLEPLRASSEISITEDPEALRTLAPTAEVMLVTGTASEAVDMQQLFHRARRVRWVHSLAAGVENLLFPALVKSDVLLTNARGVSKRSLAEFAMLGILFHTKKVRRLIDNQRQKQWDTFSVDWADGRVMGIVGFGEIGRECARLAKGLGMTIHALRRSAIQDPNQLADRMFGPLQLDAMLPTVDVLLCSAPLTPATHHMIGDAQFAKLKPSAIVINVGRGPVIDEAALIRALQSKTIAAASLDVFESEPLPESSPLWEMDNVLISPHCTDHTQHPDWLDLSMNLFVENFGRYCAGAELLNKVDKKAGY
jgi:phosphoglycerate dehydrogenase-like enzyme